SSFFGVFVITNFWLLANELYDARAARRAFAVVGAGAILGGVVGGETARAVARAFGTLQLLPVIAGGFLLARLLAYGATRACPRPAPMRPEPRPRLGAGFRLVKRRRYLRLIALLLLLSTIATTLLDLQVKNIVKDHFASDQDAMTGFFGRLASLFSLVSLIV